MRLVIDCCYRLASLLKPSHHALLAGRTPDALQFHSGPPQVAQQASVE